MLASRPTPFTWPVTLLFIGLATLLTLLVGWAIASQLLPITPELTFSEGARRLIRVWILLSLPVGIIFPTIGFIRWFRHSEIRRILGFYLVALVAQLVSEQVFSQWFSSLVVLIGNLYTFFRLWQLWQAREQLKSSPRYGRDRWLQGLLWLLLAFWVCNLMMLITLAWPTILNIYK